MDELRTSRVMVDIKFGKTHYGVDLDTSFLERIKVVQIQVGAITFIGKIDMDDFVDILEGKQVGIVCSMNPLVLSIKDRLIEGSDDLIAVDGNLLAMDTWDDELHERTPYKHG